MYRPIVLALLSVAASALETATPERFHVKVSAKDFSDYYLNHVPGLNITLIPATASKPAYDILGFDNVTLTFYSAPPHSHPGYLSIPNVRTEAENHPYPVRVVPVKPTGYAGGIWGSYQSEDGTRSLTYAVNPGNRGSFYACTVDNEKIFAFGEYATDDCENISTLSLVG